MNQVRHQQLNRQVVSNQADSRYPDASQPRLFPIKSFSSGHKTKSTNLPSRKQQAKVVNPNTKAYETSRPTDKYQPSRGAKRDAKYHRRQIQSYYMGLDNEQAAHLDLDEIHRHHAEQQLAIERARRWRKESLKRDEEAVKIRRIQLQVFVHAR